MDSEQAPVITREYLADLLVKAMGDITAALTMAGKPHVIRRWTADYVAAINKFDADIKNRPQPEPVAYLYTHASTDHKMPFLTQERDELFAQMDGTIETPLYAAPGDTTTTSAVGELVEGLRAMIPTNLGDNSLVPDDATIPVDYTMAEIRRARALIARHGGAK